MTIDDAALSCASNRGGRRRTQASRRLLRALLLPALLLPVALPAQTWQSVPRNAPPTGVPARIAEVANDGGYRLQVYLLDASRIVADFSLPRGLRTLHPEGCPTFHIVGFEVEPLNRAQASCSQSGAQARAEVARLLEGQVDSQLVLGLLNGEELEVRYRLRNAGYASTRFTLRRSKRVLLAALPPSTVIVGD